MDGGDASAAPSVSIRIWTFFTLLVAVLALEIARAALSAHVALIVNGLNMLLIIFNVPDAAETGAVRQTVPRLLDIKGAYLSRLLLLNCPVLHYRTHWSWHSFHVQFK